MAKTPVVQKKSLDPLRRTKITMDDVIRAATIRAEIGTMYLSARQAGVNYGSLMNFINKTPDAKELWEQAYEEFRESLMAEAVTRARDGWDEPIYHMGSIAGYIKRKSDRILELMLRAHIPVLFRENYHEEQVHKAQAAQFDFNSLSAKTRDAVRDHMTAIRDLVAADNATPIGLPEPEGEE